MNKFLKVNRFFKSSLLTSACLIAVVKKPLSLNTRALILFVLFIVVSQPSYAQEVEIEVREPIENRSIVIESIAPSKIGDPKQGRISVLMRIWNHGTTPMKIGKIEIMGQTVSQFTSPVHVSVNNYYEFQNCNCENSKPLIIDAPFPQTIKIAVFLRNGNARVEKSFPIVPHTNDGGRLSFPGKINDLRQNETWGTSSNHPGDKQVFALDMGVLGWNQNHWSEQFLGTTAIGRYINEKDKPRYIYRRESYRIYGMPVYAMTDGTVCWALNDHEERPTTEPSATISPSLGVFNAGGNQLFVKRGTEVSVYAHLQTGSIPQELLQPGATVKRGQYLGKVGLSDASDHPHVHIHVKKEPASGAPNVGNFMNDCDDGRFRPMTFKNIQSLTIEEAHVLANDSMLDASDWTALTNHSAPHAYGLLYPSTAAYDFRKNYAESKQYIGVWRSGNEIELRVKATGWANFTKKWEELSNDNFRLVEVNSFVENIGRVFVGVFKRGGGNHALWIADGWDSFTAKWDELSQGGLRLVDMDTYTEGGTRYFVGAFREGTDGHALWSITGWENFTQKWDEYGRNNLRLVDIETFQVGADQRQYIGVFRQGADGHTLWSVTGWNEFTAKWDEFSRNGLRLVDIETFAVGNQRQFIGVFRQGTDGYALESVFGYQNFIQACEKYNGAGLRLADVHVQQ